MNKWAADSLKARESALVLVPLVKHYDRDVASGGKTVEIPNISNLTANAKVANTQVTLNAPTETKTTITLNQHFEASILIEDILDWQSAYDLASEYTEKTGFAIAEKMDNFVATTMTSGVSAGNTLGTYGTALTYAVVRAGKLALDRAKAPITDRQLVVSPKGHDDLLGVAEFTRYDAMGASGDANSIKNGKVGYILGFPVYMSQNLVITAGTPEQNNNLMFQKEAFAIAIQKEVKFEKQRKTEYLGDLYVSQALYGGSVLRQDHIALLKS